MTERRSLIKLYLLLAAAVVLLAAPVSRADPVRVGHLTAELVSEVTSVQPGQPFWVALHLDMDDDWHVYWRNPGDAGTPPKITWDLPAGFSAGDIRWPYPDLMEAPPLTSFGFHDEVLLPVEITPPRDLSISSTVELRAHGEWLVCREICIPGESDLRLTLPVSNEPPVFSNRWANAFSDTRNRLPVRNSDWVASAQLHGREIQLALTPPGWFEDSLTSVYFFAYNQALVANAEPQILEPLASGYRLTLQRSVYSLDDPERIAGVLYAESGWRGSGSEKALEIDVPVDEATTTSIAAASGPSNLWVALLFAFLGGLILNLMPCVLPVLSLKVLGFVEQANRGSRSILSHGLIFMAGVLMSFWILAVILLLLQAGGQQLGWGFQLQSPVFLILLSGFMFLFGLNLLGVFEIGTSLTGVGSAAQSRGGWSGSLLNGVTATVVATPCTAPFMGSALGYSLSQPAWAALLIFTFLGLGMGAPYVILSASPRLLKFIPRPGRWMETLKHILGFLLLGTVVWLAWVLGLQTGSEGVVILMGTLLLLGVGAWIYGRWGALVHARRVRVAAYVFAAILVLGGLGIGLSSIGLSSTAAPVASTSKGSLNWEPYSPERVEQLRSEGRPVFIDFTAAWCLSCQVNERVAFSSDEVQRRFEELDIVPIKADWTSRNETITRALAAFGRNSVPLYVLHAGGPDRDPVILPEILTPGIVLDALAKIDSSAT
jgi:thiol:disulfide interchange protein/DsbC/DsbD-like thiol-disulfide interchange protein